MYNLEQLDTILKRFSAFWEGELYDRGMLAVTCPAQKRPSAARTRFPRTGSGSDSSYRFRRFQAECSGAVFSRGCAARLFSPNLGPGVVANLWAGNTAWPKIPFGLTAILLCRTSPRCPTCPWTRKAPCGVFWRTIMLRRARREKTRVLDRLQRPRREHRHRSRARGRGKPHDGILRSSRGGSRSD